MKTLPFAITLGLLNATGSQAALAQEKGETYHFVCSSKPAVRTDDASGLEAYGAEPVTKKFATYGEAADYEELLEKRFAAQAAKVGRVHVFGSKPSASCNTFSETELQRPDRREVFESFLIGGPGYEVIGKQRIPVRPSNVPGGWENIPAPSETKPPEQAGKTNGGGSTSAHIVIEDREPIGPSKETLARALAEQRRVAQNMAKAAAEAAKANAELKAKLAKMLEESRKRCRPSTNGEKGACAQ